MRLLTRRIYRAFPELDRYSDEQCLRFVKAARGSWLRRLVRSMFVLSVGLAGVMAGGVLLTLIFNDLGPRHDPFTGGLRDLLLGLALGTIILAPSPFTAFVLRDALLRRRVRFVLRTRGVCSNCWYSLVGLAVGPDNAVQCPECGHTTTVDPSLGELVTAPDGRVRFKPDFAGPDLSGRYWNPARTRIFRRVVLRCLATFAIVAVVLAGGYEIALRRQAAAARAAMPGQKGLEGLLTTFGVPPPRPEDEDHLEILRQIQGIEKQIAEERAQTNPVRVEPEFNLIYASAADKLRRKGWGCGDPVAAEAAARARLDAYPSRGVYPLLDRLAAIQGWRVVKLWDADDESCGQGHYVFYSALTLAEACIARAGISLEAGDRAAAANAIEHAMAIHRLIDQTPIPYTAYREATIQSALLDRAIEYLMPPIDARPIEVIEGIIRRQQSQDSAEFHVEVERLWVTQTFGEFFGDPDRLRFGRASPGFPQALGVAAAPAGRIGSWRENQQAITREFDSLAELVRLEPWQRAVSASPPAPAGSGLLLPAMWGMGRGVVFSQELRDINLLRRRGIRALIAIERHRLAAGRYPAKLEDLIPAYLTELPRDPFSGKSLAYRTIDPATDPHGRGYLLYSLGLDGIDDNGRTNAQDRTFPLKSASTVVTSSTQDYVINEPPPK